MNSLGQDLTGKVVIIKTMRQTGTTDSVITRVFVCESGDGLQPEGGRVGIEGFFLANPAIPRGQRVIIDASDDIERMADRREVEAATY